MRGALAKGGRLPDYIYEEPPMPAGGEVYLHAFWRLSTCRPIGFGVVGPIPVTAIVWYFERQGMARDLVDAAVEIIREMDAGYLAHQAEKAPKHKDK